MNTDNINLLILFGFFVVVVIYFIAYIRNGNCNEVEFDKHYPNIEEETKIISIRIENKAQEELTLDLFKLDKNDSRYKINYSCDYDMLCEYAKVKNFNVQGLRIRFNERETFLKVATLKVFSPHDNAEFPLVVPVDDFDRYQFQTNIIQSNESFLWDYFNDVRVRVVGHEYYSIDLFITEKPLLLISKEDILFGLIIGNDTDEVKQVKLLNEEYWTQNKNEIESYLPNISYDEILKQRKIEGLFPIRKLKFFNYEGNSFESKVTLNHMNFKINEYKQDGQLQPDFIDIDFLRTIPSSNFSIELQPKSKIIILAK